MTETVIERSKSDARPCLIFADDKTKLKWDIFIVILLVVVCIIIPWRLAFANQELIWEVIYYLVDFLFLTDIFLTFITTIPDKEKMVQITDRCKIANNYIQGWFLVDLISIIPFDIFLSAAQQSPRDVNFLVRVTRFSKIYKLIRLMRIMKIFKAFRAKSSISFQFQQSLQINNGTERLMFSSVIFMFVCHVAACVFVIIG